MSEIPQRYRLKTMGGSNSKDEKNSAQTVVVSGQANVTLSDHDMAQWWVIACIIFVVIFVLFVFFIRRVYIWFQNLSNEQRNLRLAIIELRSGASAKDVSSV